MQYPVDRPARKLPFALAFVIALLVVPVGLFAAEEAPAPRASAAEESREYWQVIHMDKDRVGYSRSSSRPLVVNKRKLLRSEMEMHMTIKRFGQTLKMQTTLEVIETPEGEMVSYDFQMKNPPVSLSHTVGRIEGSQLKIETTIAGVKQNTSINWDPAVKSPAYQDRLLRETGFKPGESRSFKAFLPEFNQIATVHLAAEDYRSMKLLDGTERKLLKVTMTQSLLPTVPIRAYLDESGEALMTVTEVAGQTLTTYKVDADEALKEIAGGELDIAVNTLVKTRRIPHAHQTKKIVYRLTLPGEDLTQHFVSGGTQTVQANGPGSALVTVTAVTPSATGKTVRAEPEYLESSLFLQSNDPEVMRHAEQASLGETDPARIAVRMEQYVNKRLKKKNFSTALASAAEVARALEGDCTEHAVLLAAMLRAKKIPSRIAVGMVYAESLSAFGGHMWTEAFLGGEWIPLDATLGRGGIGAAHLKMAESSFSANSPSPVLTFMPLLRVLGKLSIEPVEIE